MRFWVRVPVLSEQMQLVDPSVSTASRFLTSTFLSAMRFAVRERHTVTVARRPSGTLATIMPIVKIKFVMILYLKMHPRIKNNTPKKNELGLHVLRFG